MAVLTKITQRSLADNAVTASHVQADALAAGDIAAGAIGSSELADDAVGAAQLASNAVVDASVASSAAIGLSKLATTGALSATSLTATNIIGNPKATNATTVAGTYSSEQEVVHGSTFTTTGSTVTGDVVFKSLTDETVTLSGTGTVTGSGGKVTLAGLGKTDYVTKSGGGFTGTIQAPHIMTGKATFGEGSIESATLRDATLTGTLSGTGTIGNDIKFPAGHVLQVTSYLTTIHWTQTINTTSANWEYARNSGGDLVVSITPKHNTSKVLVSFNFGQISAHNSGTGYGLGLVVERTSGTNFTNATRIQTNTSGNTPACTFAAPTYNLSYDAKASTFSVLDTPSTTQRCNYKIVIIAHSSGNYVAKFNRSGSVGSDQVSGHQTVSSTNFIAMEIAG